MLKAPFRMTMTPGIDTHDTRANDNARRTQRIDQALDSQKCGQIWIQFLEPKHEVAQKDQIDERATAKSWQVQGK